MPNGCPYVNAQPVDGEPISANKNPQRVSVTALMARAHRGTRIPPAFARTVRPSARSFFTAKRLAFSNAVQTATSSLSFHTRLTSNVRNETNIPGTKGSVRAHAGKRRTTPNPAPAAHVLQLPTASELRFVTRCRQTQRRRDSRKSTRGTTSCRKPRERKQGQRRRRKRRAPAYARRKVENGREEGNGGGEAGFCAAVAIRIRARCCRRTQMSKRAGEQRKEQQRERATKAYRAYKQRCSTQPQKKALWKATGTPVKAV